MEIITNDLSFLGSCINQIEYSEVACSGDGRKDGFRFVAKMGKNCGSSGECGTIGRKVEKKLSPPTLCQASVGSRRKGGTKGE